MSPPRYVIPKPPCPRTRPTVYMPPCRLVPGGNAPLNALDGSVPRGAPHVTHAALPGAFSLLHIGHRVTAATIISSATTPESTARSSDSQSQNAARDKNSRFVGSTGF